jgi:multiple sugar transport system permease protein
VLLRTIWDFKEFDLIYLLTGGGPVNATETLPLLVYQRAFGMNAMGRASTYAIGIMLVLLIFMILYLNRTRRERGAAA